MATVTPELIAEGESIIAKHDAEEIHRFGDRVVSVEPDNWYGLYVRGVGYCLEVDLKNAVDCWTRSFAGIEDEAYAERMVPGIVDSLAFCLNHMKGGEVDDFKTLGELISTINGMLPESDGEVIVIPVIDRSIEFFSENPAEFPFTAYYTLKALAMTAFRAYVEMRIFVDIFTKLALAGEKIKVHASDKAAGAIESDRIFVDMMLDAVRGIVDNTPAEELDAIEEYWLEHSIDPYLSHLMQAYQMSSAMATSGKFLSKMAKKVMTSEVELFSKFYLAAKR